jgi:hypothetical protein
MEEGEFFAAMATDRSDAESRLAGIKSWCFGISVSPEENGSVLSATGWRTEVE